MARYTSSKQRPLERKIGMLMTICLLWLLGQNPGWLGPHHHRLQPSQPLTNLHFAPSYITLIYIDHVFGVLIFNQSMHSHKIAEIRAESVLSNLLHSPLTTWPTCPTILSRCRFARRDSAVRHSCCSGCLDIATETPVDWPASES